MSEPLELLEQHLRQHHNSLTAPRRKVFQALQRDKPLTMSELLTYCDGVDRVSVYRTIELFEKLHIVQRLQIGWKYKLELSGAFAPHHHHASCERCGTVFELANDESIEQQVHQLAASLNFDMHDHQLEIRGLCAHCQSLGTS